MTDAPRFHLKRVYADGSEEAAGLVWVGDLPLDAQLGRRTFLGAAGVAGGALGALGVVGCAPKKPAPVESIVAFRVGVESLQFTPDGKSLIVLGSDDDERCKVWSVPGGVQRPGPELPSNWTRPLMLSADGLSILFVGVGTGGAAAAAPPQRVNVWSVADGVEKPAIELPAGAPGVAWLSDDARFVTIEQPKGLIVVSLKDGRRTTIRTRDQPGSSVFSPDGRYLAGNVFSQRGVFVWSLEDGALIAALDAELDPSGELCFSPDGQLLATCSRDEVKLWSIPKGDAVATLTARQPEDNRTTVQFSRDGRWLFTLAGFSNLRRLKVWSVPDGALKVALPPEGSVTSWQFDAQGSWFAGDSGLWSLPDGALIAKFTTDDPYTGDAPVASSSDGRWLATRAQDGAVRLWSTQDGALKATLPTQEEETPYDKPPTPAFSPDGRLLANANKDGAIRLWSVPGGKPITDLFDKAALDPGLEVSQVDIDVNVDVDVTLRVTRAQSCATPIARGATCTCNCVSGTYRKPATRVSSGSSRGGSQACGSGVPPGAVCTCNCVVRRR